VITSLILADNLGFASCFHVAEAAGGSQPWLPERVSLSCHAKGDSFLQRCLSPCPPPFQPALVSAVIPADTEMLFYLLLRFFLCVDYLQLLNCLKEPSFSCYIIAPSAAWEQSVACWPPREWVIVPQPPVPSWPGFGGRWPGFGGCWPRFGGRPGTGEFAVSGC